MDYGLETNVPRTLMTFKDFPYPTHVSLFPTHGKIKENLERYANDIRGCIKFNSEVMNVKKVTRDYNRQWKVTVQDTTREEIEQVDQFSHAVVVATGTFNRFYRLDDVPLGGWEDAHPGSVIESRDFRSPQDFQDKVSKIFYNLQTFQVR